MGKEIDLNQIHQIQLDMMNLIHEFCVKNQIRYSLGGGTLLGAVRHKGFIPWDDDIDIMMPRSDYERFIRDFEGQFSHLGVQHYKNDYSYCCTFAKIYDNRTIIIQKDLKTAVFVDVFPLDGMPEESKLSSFLRKLWWLKKIMNYTLETETPVTRFPILSKIVSFVMPHSLSVSLVDKFMKSYDFETSKYAGALSGVYGKKEHMESFVFKNYILLPFEGELFFGIADYDAYLKKHYGDYMKLPPKEKQVPHHAKAYWKD